MAGNMSGIRGADFACYCQARKAGFKTTFRAFISTRIQVRAHIDKKFHQSPWKRGQSIVSKEF